MTVCFRIAVFLIYFIMCTSAGSNLRQVGDADYLTVPVAHFLHHVRHAVGYFTGDAGIYFIKYDSRQFHSSGNQCFDRKHDTGNFTSRSYGRDILQGTILIGRKQEVDCIFSLQSRLFLQSHFDLETNIRHPQRNQAGSQLLFHFTRSFRTGFGEQFCLLFHLLILFLFTSGQLGNTLIV